MTGGRGRGDNKKERREPRWGVGRWKMTGGKGRGDNKKDRREASWGDGRWQGGKVMGTTLKMGGRQAAENEGSQLRRRRRQAMGRRKEAKTWEKGGRQAREKKGGKLGRRREAS